VQSNITIADLDTVNADFEVRLAGLVRETVTPLVGRQLKSVRAFKESSDGSYVEHEITVTVTGGFMNGDGGISLEGTYPHPLSGKPMNTEISV